MRSFRKAVALALIVNALALAGAAGWLWSTGRLSRDRIERTREIFHLTLAQEKQDQDNADKLAEEAKAKALDVARLESVAANGAVSLSQRLNSEQRADDLATQRVERLQRDIADLRQQLVHAKDLLARQKSELEAQRKSFEERVARQNSLSRQDDFQQAVKTYEQLEPEQVKAMFQTLIKDGKVQDVIDYLAAMQMRKAAAVLKEFKSPEEIPTATDLIQRLRDRGLTNPPGAGDMAKETTP